MWKEWNFIELRVDGVPNASVGGKLTRSDEFALVVPDPSGGQSVTRQSQRHIPPKDPADGFERLTI